MKHSKIHVPGFSGSYEEDDITFLLKEVALAPTPVGAKEAAIQSGNRHYSEMISEEARPDARYLAIFRQAWADGRERIAREVAAIGATIREMIAGGDLPPQVTLCSLVRAGAPLGVLLRRELADAGVDVAHFGVSIIRDRGLDMNAMRHVMALRDPAGILFVDGWTGKGAIARELRRSWRGETGRDPILVVLADPCGEADLSGSHEDWLIPSGILGANISGLISRSILNSGLIGPADFHGYVPVTHLADIDFSRAFVDDIHGLMRAIGAGKGRARRSGTGDLADNPQRQAAQDHVASIMVKFGITNANRVKPGIAEATRAVLRRAPERVLLRARDDSDLAALIHLCEAGRIPHTVDPGLTGPYRAITLISKA
ncbi:cysteine protease StiP family protein [Defluviimonas salinarum]|uniref:Cysteine protease StiP family protein n=1 Tax=Defluviimonas salinarum TaxID=2992147 RepID=A0ABT3J540_9RHOB|nr:cysteine protease StiP family protein [Defluviimonas salinarum]MCW3782529.1 cysteine protease StiP family protein [Defluviimonas salinarum]